MSHDTEWNAFQARREELRRERRRHTPLELPAEYHRLTEHLRQSMIYCGESHAEGVAASYGAMFGWEPAALMRGANT